MYTTHSLKSYFSENALPNGKAMEKLGSAGRVQGENNCNDFRREFYLLGHRYKTYAATNAEVHEKSDTTIVCFFALLY